jgi:hypothetical protein
MNSKGVLLFTMLCYLVGLNLVAGSGPSFEFPHHNPWENERSEENSIRGFLRVKNSWIHLVELRPEWIHEQVRDFLWNPPGSPEIPIVFRTTSSSSDSRRRKVRTSFTYSAKYLKSYVNIFPLPPQLTDDVVHEMAKVARFDFFREPFAYWPPKPLVNFILSSQTQLRLAPHQEEMKDTGFLTHILYSRYTLKDLSLFLLLAFPTAFTSPSQSQSQEMKLQDPFPTIINKSGPIIQGWLFCIGCYERGIKIHIHIEHLTAPHPLPC